MFPPAPSLTKVLGLKTWLWLSAEAAKGEVSAASSNTSAKECLMDKDEFMILAFSSISEGVN